MTHAKLEPRCNRGRAGYSLVELLAAMVIFVGFLAAVMAALSDAMVQREVQGTYALMQMDARRALDRISSELRMSGRIPNPAPGQPEYPYTFVNGGALGVYNHPSRHEPAAKHVGPESPAFGDNREIAFRIPADIDGDGLLTSSATGKIEWCDYDVAYVLVTGADGTNTLERWEDGERTDVIARYVERIAFDTINTDPTIDMNSVVVNVYVARPTAMGVWLEMHVWTVVNMRNTDGLVTPAPSAI